jgi:hypothetical protein
VFFEHRRHQEENGREKSCPRCHHLHKTGDAGTPCSECHRAMYTATDIFDHSRHVAAVQGIPSCVKCHGAEKPVVPRDGKTCQDCHREDMMAANPVVQDFDTGRAAGYRAAMHKMCIPCHASQATNPLVARPGLGRCGTCHDEGTRSERRYHAAIRMQKGGEALR